MRSCILLLLVLCGCQTSQQKSQALVVQRAGQLKHLSGWKSTWCQVDAELTEPSKARFDQMFPFDKIPDEMSFAWRARESTCEVTALDRTAAAKGQASFLNTALCLLMQVHFVNSPFDELPVTAENIRAEKDLTHIATAGDSELGMYLRQDAFVVETRTKSHGTLRASYGPRDGVILPERLEEDRGKTKFVVDEIEYDLSGSRPMLKAFWISVGAEQVSRQAHAIVRDCRPL